MRTTQRSIFTSVVGAVVAVSIGCTDIGSDNEPPVAAIDVYVNGMLSEGPIPFAGTPLTVMLDGTRSTDPDGQIQAFTWQRTDVTPQERYSIPVDGGMPPPFMGDPPAGPMTQVVFNSPGTAQYALWVVDDEEQYSEAATVDLEVVIPYMPDAACMGAYPNPNTGCAECVCTPADMMGCLDAFQNCYNNPDPMFVTLCTAVIACGIEAGCKGSACYTGGCMAEIDAASQYNGGTLADCSMGDPTTNPCMASSWLGNCTNETNCMSACQ